MTKYCLNCNAALTGKFCSDCGQPSDTHKINFHFLWHDIQHGLFHFEKGILYTTKELFTRPGHSIREFLNGKRVKHFKPISLVVLLAGVYGLLTHFFNINLLSNNFVVTGSGVEVNERKESIQRISEWISQHYSLITLVQIPVFAIISLICFNKAGYNYIEHVIINTFIASQKLTIHIIAFPLYWLFKNTPLLSQVARATDFIGYLIPIWTFLQLFTQLSSSQRIWRTLLSIVLSLGVIYVSLLIISKSMLG